MKIVFTSMLVLLITAIQAMPGENDSITNGKKSTVSTPATNPSSTSLVSLQQLQEENAALKARLAEMENRLENENSLLQFKFTMANLVNKLNESRKVEKLEDLEGQINFTNLMTQTLLRVNTRLAR